MKFYKQIFINFRFFVVLIAAGSGSGIFIFDTDPDPKHCFCPKDKMVVCVAVFESQVDKINILSTPFVSLFTLC